MTLADTIQRVKSGVISINFINAQNQLLAKGSGFMSNGFLVTNNHVFQGPPNSRVWLRTHDTSETDLSQGLVLDIANFRSYLRAGSDEKHHDYAVMEIPQLKTKNLYNFELVAPSNSRIGDNICLLGYPLEHMNLTAHKGIISSFFTRNNVCIIQIDASVNASNSGGPLINEEGKVIGIVTRKATGLTNMVDELKKSIEANIGVIQNARRGGGGITVMGVDPMEGLEISQVQALAVIREIERSANVGIGYAFSSQHLLEDNIFN